MERETKQYKVLSCPKCGNDSSKHGISFMYLEWRVHDVLGVDKEKIAVESDAYIGQVGVGEKVTATNIPENESDLSHFHCKACKWNWHEDRARDWPYE